MKHSIALTFLAVLIAVTGNRTAVAADVDALVAQGVAQAERSEHSAALDAFDRAIKQDASAAQPCYWRGRSLFCLGKVKPAVADFDRYVELAPKARSQQWELGIALYYAGEFERGAKQFELYQTFHDNDVENSVWRYLCVARTDGVKKAQETILPIKNDPRVPMMAVYELYQGKKTPEDVLAAAKEGKPSEGELNAREFYAHLYVGLWYEAAGKADLAATHIGEAEKHRIGHYMWDVARVHNELRRDEAKDKK
jgi:lipoprotein NlpI